MYNMYLYTCCNNKITTTIIIIIIIMQTMIAYKCAAHYHCVTPPELESNSTLIPEQVQLLEYSAFVINSLCFKLSL